MLARAVNSSASQPPPPQPPQPQPPRGALERQLFPSSSPASPGGDIRQQFGRAAARGAAVGASARTAPPLPDAASSRPASAATSSLASLYRQSAAFGRAAAAAAAAVDVTQAAAHPAVEFAEDDFSDDNDLDLDYEAPKPPQQRDVAIPWSSSPASHFEPPKPQRSVSRAAAAAAPHNSLKRELPGDSDGLDAPHQKRAKKRVLPPSFGAQRSAPELLDAASAAPAPPRTPASKSQGYFDPSASAIADQKRQFKNQRGAARPEEEAPPQEPCDGGAGFATKPVATKPVAISLSSEQEHVLDLVVNKSASVFFTGPAGAGKSVLMRAIIDRLREKYRRDSDRVAVTASTGLAACNIGGMTLHSFAGIGLGKEDAPTLVRKIRRNPKVKNRWLRVKCLIIDEVSMVDGDLFDKLDHIGRVLRSNGRPWGGIQLVITGDFFQLPPVPDHDKQRDAKFAFDAATWSTSIDHTIGLTQIFRQRDPEFARMLNEMRLGKISQDTVNAFRALSRPLTFDDGVESAELYPTRSQVDMSNERRLRELPGQSFRYDAQDSGDPKIRERLLANMISPKVLELKLHAQVMLIKNMDDSLVNGSLGKVIGFSDERTYEMTSTASYDDSDASLAKAKRKLKAFSHESAAAAQTGHKYPVVQFVSMSGAPRTILCVPEEWKVELPNGEVQAKRNQIPLILAWALSIHKAQGQTLERVTVNLGRVFEKGQAYVALSRAVSKQGLRVLSFDRAKVMAHSRVVEFYGRLYSAEQANGPARPGSILDFVAGKRGLQPVAPAAPGAAAKRVDVVDLDDDEEAMASYGM